MALRFSRHYTLTEARALLPQVRGWLSALQEGTAEFKKLDHRLAQLSQAGHDLGGPSVNDWLRLLIHCVELLMEFEHRQILVKDLKRGLVDFPSLRGGREVFLCWEADEEDIQFWHELDGGYGGREAVEE